MKFPPVTVLVTAKNAKDTIKKCVESILKLDYPNYKIFITDAFSTDGTYEILKQFQEKYPKRIRLERIKGNIATAHNYMIKQINTQLIAMTDADCIVDKKWLRNLISGFSSNDVVATAGFCSTPKNVNRLQRLIGMELENRFKHFPEFISRAPTMNLCVRTSAAKKVKFDERLDVAQETEWGYRLTKLGKMKYVSEAIVWHHHRPTWKSFFKQQFRYGRFVPFIYLRRRVRYITGDHISTPSIFLQLLTFSSMCLFIFLSLLVPSFTLFAIVLLLVLLFLYVQDILKLTRKLDEIILFFFIFFIRTIAWSIGIAYGIFNLIRAQPKLLHKSLSTYL